MHEAFETNNWYNDISTRDRSREGAEEAIDLSEGFKNPNFRVRVPPVRARSRRDTRGHRSGLRAAAGALARTRIARRARNAVSRAFAEVFTKLALKRAG